MNPKPNETATRQRATPATIEDDRDLSEHVMRARCWITLIRAAANVQDDIVDPDDVGEAINMAAIEAADELDHLQGLPTEIANWRQRWLDEKTGGAR